MALSLDSYTNPTKLLLDTNNSDLFEGELTILLNFKVSDYNFAFAEIILDIQAAAIPEVIKEPEPEPETEKDEELESETDEEQFIPFVPIFNIIEEEVSNIDENSPDPEPLEESE